MVLRDSLGWLDGFPNEETSRGRLGWTIVPRVGEDRHTETIEIDRSTLRRSTYALSKLTGELRPGLRRLVGDPAAWAKGVEARLEFLKSAIHRGEPMPLGETLLERSGMTAPQKRATSRLVERHPSLSLTIASLIWLHWHDASGLRGRLRLIDRNAPAFEALVDGVGEGLGLVSALRLCDLSVADGANRVAPFLAFFGDRRVYTVPLQGWNDVDNAVRRVLTVSIETRMRHDIRCLARLPRRPKAEFAESAARALVVLSRKDTGERRRFLRLWDLVLPRAALDAWYRWWTISDSMRDEANRLLSKVSFARSEIAKLEGLEKRVARHVSLSPAKFPEPVILKGLMRLASGSCEEVCREVVSIAGSIPEVDGHLPVRSGMVTHWSQIAKALRAAPRRAAGAARALRELLRGRSDPTWVLGPWKSVLDGGPYWDSPEADLTENEPASLARYRDRVRIIDRLVPRNESENGPPKWLDSDSWLTIESLLRSGATVETTERIIEYAIARGALRIVLKAGNVATRVFLKLSDEDPVRFVNLALAVPEHVWEDESFCAIDRLISIVEAPRDLEDILVRLEFAEWRPLVQLAEAMLALDRRGGFVMPARRTSRSRSDGAKSWVSRYPKKLHAAIRRLERVDADARRSASVVLGKSCPDPERLAREIASIRLRIDDAPRRNATSMRKRIENLEIRRRARGRLSAEKLERLGEKLERRIRLARVKAWIGALEAEVRSRLEEELGGPVPPGWSTDADTSNVVAHLLALSGRDRSVALKVLRARRDDPPWDLRDAVANQRFIASLERRGIDMEPWVDGVGTMEFAATDKGPERVVGKRRRRKSETILALELEDDPLEVFLMGEHFDTCLSVGDVNFFSVVANVADINKRVVYARDLNGSIQGRCLLALTRQGRLLTFCAYAHDADLQFPKMVGEFAAELASRMGTDCTPRGEVPTLVAANWYDDGPRDLTGRFGFLDPGSRFRCRLGEIEIDALEVALREEFAPQDLDATTLPLVLHLDELDQRPELVRALVGAIRQNDDLAFEHVLRASQLLRKSRDPELARLLLSPFCDGPRFRRVRQDWLIEGLVEALVDVGEPGRALAILRKTRPRRVRSWDDEEHDRRLYAAKAHDALGRKKIARRLFSRQAKRP
jgi:hypothetical protein